MDRNNVIGFILLAVLFAVWMQINTSQRKKALVEKQTQDSIALVKSKLQTQDSLAAIAAVAPIADTTKANDTTGSSKMVSLATQVLENENLKITFSNQSNQIQSVQLKKYQFSAEDKNGEELRGPLILQNNKSDVIGYEIGTKDGMTLNTNSLPTEISSDGQKVTLTTKLTGNASLLQTYSLSDKPYELNYEATITGSLEHDPAKAIQFKWVNHLNKLEKNFAYENTYSTLFFKSPGESSDYCSYTKNDETSLGSSEKLEWVSSVNQFFNTSLMPEQPFESAKLSIHLMESDATVLKRTEVLAETMAGFATGKPFKMKMYAGPNEFNTLREYDNSLHDIIPFGSNIMGTINKWIIRPIFVFLGYFFSNQGIVILLLTLIVKLALWPLTYRMIYSQSKMSALKPEMDKLKTKYGDDAQKIQMETMTLYRENGVNPLGGCMPMLLQMPIWFALYRFFPAAIEFRQEGFLWANDLSSYDAIIRFPVSVPLLGHHLSLFTVLWTVSTLLYTWYNFKKIDLTSTAANPALKYMQYIMPVAFMFFFNSFASGLTCYLVFSNLLNIAQTVVTKNYLINEDKIRRELDAFKKKPKKKGGFSDRLNTMLKEQQRIAEERAKTKK